MNNTKKLYRSKTDRIIFGVCGGLGEYFELDPLIVRILFILLAFSGGSGIIIYLILAVIIPEGKEENGKSKKMDEIIEDAQTKTQDLAEQIKNNGNWISNIRNIIGLIVVLWGFDILFKQIFNFSAFAWVNWSVFWALIIILIGAKIILSNKK